MISSQNQTVAPKGERVEEAGWLVVVQVVQEKFTALSSNPATITGVDAFGHTTYSQIAPSSTISTVTKYVMRRTDGFIRDLFAQLKAAHTELGAARAEVGRLNAILADEEKKAAEVIRSLKERPPL